MVKAAIQVTTSLKLRMTPQMQQAIRLLQLPILDLKALIDEALNENVFLESEEAEIPEAESYALEHTGPSNLPSDGIDRITYKETLPDYLNKQLNLGEHKNKIGYAIIDSIDENGYLTADLPAIRDTVAPEMVVSIGEIEAVLEQIQQLDPAGVGARTSEECVLIQLKQLDSGIPGLELACSIVEKEKLVDLNFSKEFDRLKQELGASDEDWYEAIALIKNCELHPCKSINAPTAQTMIPDVFVRQVDDSLKVVLNDAFMPQLKINQIYAKALRGNEKRFTELNQQLIAAKWLVQSLEERRKTLQKAALPIVRQQKEFFEKGPEYMRPMVHRDIAQAIEMNESTVSRIAATKWMQTPRGPLEFSYFFSSGLNSSSGKKSSTAVRAIIQKLINNENKRHPLSDKKIADLLLDKEIHVAPRTVTKYRKKDGIPKSTERKKR